MEYYTTNSSSGSTDFGDLTVARQAAGASSKIRGLFINGQGDNNTNTIDYITIATTGNASDFGDSLDSSSQTGATSADHGGLA